MFFQDRRSLEVGGECDVVGTGPPASVLSATAGASGVETKSVDLVTHRTDRIKATTARAANLLPGTSMNEEK
jgi:hypothetical protein